MPLSPPCGECMNNNFQTELAKQLQDSIQKEGSNKTAKKDIKNHTSKKQIQQKKRKANEENATPCFS